MADERPPGPPVDRIEIRIEFKGQLYGASAFVDRAFPVHAYAHALKRITELAIDELEKMNA